MGLLDGKRIVITGVLTDASIAFGVAKLAQEEGASIILTGAGRGLSLTERTARKLPAEAPVLELDVTEPAHLESVRAAVAERWDGVDGVLHAIGFAPAVCLGGNFMDATWDDVSVAMHVSSYSLKALVDAFGPLMGPGSSLVGLDFDATVAWPAYDWMGVAKAALESTARYLARELGRRGIRVNLVAAGPIRTMAAKSIPGFAAFEDAWQARAPLGLGHQRHRARSPGPAWHCCRTGSPPPPARWSTSTAGITPSAPERRTPVATAQGRPRPSARARGAVATYATPTAFVSNMRCPRDAVGPRSCDTEMSRRRRSGQPSRRASPRGGRRPGRPAAGAAGSADHRGAAGPEGRPQVPLEHLARARLGQLGDEADRAGDLV